MLVDGLVQDGATADASTEAAARAADVIEMAAGRASHIAEMMEAAMKLADGNTPLQAVLQAVQSEATKIKDDAERYFGDSAPSA